MANRNTQLMRGLSILPNNPERFTEKDRLLYELLQGIAREEKAIYDRKQLDAEKRRENKRLDTGVRQIDLSGSELSLMAGLTDRVSARTKIRRGSVVTPEFIDYVYSRSKLERVDNRGNLLSIVDSLYEAVQTCNGQQFRQHFWKRWELRRVGADTLFGNSKIRKDMFWSPHAASYQIYTSRSGVSGAEIGRQLMLEHVVPLKVIKEIFVACYRKDKDLAIEFLEDSVQHTVLTYSEDENLRQMMDKTEINYLKRHALGDSTLSAKDLFEVRYGRYLESERVNLGSFARLDEYQEMVAA